MFQGLDLIPELLIMWSSIEPGQVVMDGWVLRIQLQGPLIIAQRLGIGSLLDFTKTAVDIGRTPPGIQNNGLIKIL